MKNKFIIVNDAKQSLVTCVMVNVFYHNIIEYPNCFPEVSVIKWKKRGNYYRCPLCACGIHLLQIAKMAQALRCIILFVKGIIISCMSLAIIILAVLKCSTLQRKDT